MKWQIPAKTFLVGEYAALAGGSAILLTTTPCFEMTLVSGNVNQGLHPDSPAGQWWASHRIPDYCLHWFDPYEGRGGLGASSAQFIGAYLATCHLLNVKASRQVLMDAYYQSSWRGEGLKPSGYDVIAQTRHRCVFINRQKDCMEAYEWPFSDIVFLLVHSGQKLATHYHLQNASLPVSTAELSAIVDQAKTAFVETNSKKLVQAVNDYQQALDARHLVAQHSLSHINVLKSNHNILAAKGCGALGADVLLLIMPTDSLLQQQDDLSAEGWVVLASSHEVYSGKPLLKNNPSKTLEILP